MRAGEVRFDGISFAYQEGRSILSDVNFVARPGEAVALIWAHRFG